MAKMTIFIFFIVGLAIFLFVKFALIGLRTAYDHVEKIDPLGKRHTQDEIQNAFEVTSGVLQMQMARACDSHSDIETFRRRARDDFSLGYICGFLNVTMQVARIDAGNTFEHFLPVFARLFGDIEGMRLLEKTKALQEISELFEKGRVSGIDDALMIAGGGSRRPIWLSYLEESPSVTSLLKETKIPAHHDEPMSFEQWLDRFKLRCSQLNNQLDLDESGTSLVDFIDKGAFRRAYEDGKDPEEIAELFAPKFDLKKFGRL